MLAEFERIYQSSPSIFERKTHSNMLVLFNPVMLMIFSLNLLTCLVKGISGMGDSDLGKHTNSSPTHSSPPSSSSSRKRKSPNLSKVNLHNPSGHAVILSDLKFDDTVAIGHLARSEKYKSLHVVGSGIHDHEKAKGHLHDFVKSQGLNKGKPKIRYYSGGENVLQNKPEDTHESNFQGSPKKVKLEADTHLARNLGKGKKVDVYAIAPSHPRHINALADNQKIKLRTVHHLAGYNSHIQHSPNKKPDLDHWSSINQRIKKNHPKADFLLTSTPQTFTNQDGATLTYEQLKDKYPRKHLDAAKNDPFHVRQLNKAEVFVGPHRQQKNEIPHLHPGNQKEEYANKPLQTLINQARFEEYHLPKDQQHLRNHFNRYIDHALPIVKKEAITKEPKLSYRLENGVREAFTKSPRLEACDGIHVACVNNIRKTKDRQSVVSGTFYRDTEKEGELATIRLRQSKPGDSHHGHLIINQTGDKASKLLMESFGNDPNAKSKNK